MIKIDDYSRVASEYYDPSLHPTCSNFREIGLLALRKHYREIFQSLGSRNPVFVETGAGKSTAAEFLDELDFPIKNLIIQDKSAEMLSYSKRWQNQIAHAFISDARKMPLENASSDIVFSFLLDPYDTPELISEVYRILKDGAQWVFTTPSYDWSKQFRDPSYQSVAEFVSRSGEKHYLPSYLKNPLERLYSMEREGFHLTAYEIFGTNSLKGKVSEKLVSRSDYRPVLEFYSFKKLK